MLRLTFTEEQRQILSRERFQHPHPRVRKKFEVVWLKSQGLRILINLNTDSGRT